MKHIIVDEKRVSIEEAYKMAVSMYRTDYRKEAAALLEHIAGVAPEHAGTQNALGIIALDSGNLEIAYQYVLNAINLDNNNAKAKNTMGLILQQSGKLDSAEEMFRRAISLNNLFAEAHANLGQLLLKRNMHAEATEAFRLAVNIHPENWAFHYYQAVALDRAGFSDEAETAFYKTLEVKPDFPQAHNDLGRCYAQLGNFKKAENCFHNALKIAPDFYLAIKNLAHVFVETGRPAEAESCYRKVLLAAPADSECSISLGEVLLDMQRPEEALETFRSVISLNTESVAAHIGVAKALIKLNEIDRAEKELCKVLSMGHNSIEAYNELALLCMKVGRYDEAESYLTQALEISSESVKTLTNMGYLNLSVGELKKATYFLNRSVEIDPHCYQALCNFGVIQFKVGEFEKAVETQKQVVTLAPWHDAGWSNMAAALIKIGKIHQAIDILEKLLSGGANNFAALVSLGDALSQIGKANDALIKYRKALSMDPEDRITYQSLLLTMNYSSTISAEDLFQESRNWGAAVENKYPAVKLDTDQNEKRRLRIGYISPDFRIHSVSYFFLPVIKNHNHKVVEVYCYSDVSNHDDTTVQIRSMADKWRDCFEVSDKALAEMIREDRIDILVDLTGHTGQNRLNVFALKPAPVQVTWLGYPATTGLSTIDFRITDNVADPEGASDRFYTEKLFRLPYVFLCYSPWHKAPAVAPAPFERNGYITFGSFNNPAKITEETVSLWIEVLKHVSNSHLLLKNKIFVEDDTVRLFSAPFEQAGIPKERLQFQSYSKTTEEHLAAYSQVDIALDTFPYHGTTTTCEALWMGVPVVTLSGDRHAARVGASILGSVGLADLICSSHTEYVEQATRLAADSKRLRQLRYSMRDLMKESHLCDYHGFARQLETAYLQMWSSCT